ncbi:heme ABC transporter ATP-binding protein [Paenibacillus tarimensis]|uniref:heme ABC transporter ATP-binding protein n=1 Tax=Paenibacillus tarimensis TaxID=416012 RepID=UPI001F30CC73|nr:heme ABC transporter ATP-binding protein [Paenibacillus tarimensis]MCF2944801.1 heme ABC transporter ATP-binding protein [Paenibacillus tarimensis]
MIEVEQVHKRIGSRDILQDISFTWRENRMYGIIGPNGAGKSTLLSLLSGVEPYQSGRIRLRGRPIEEYGRKELARWLAVLQQEALPKAAFTVREIVAMGRYPFQNWLGQEEKDAEELVDRALQLVGLHAMGNRRLHQLSGGERQRAALAKVIVQQPQLILLDEPTTYLDIGYQVQLLDTVRSWQRTEGLTVVAVLHDLNLAAQYCDELLVLQDGRIAAAGTLAEVLTEEMIRSVYGADPIVLTHPEHGVPQVLLRRGKEPE